MPSQILTLKPAILKPPEFNTTASLRGACLPVGRALLRSNPKTTCDYLSPCQATTTRKFTCFKNNLYVQNPQVLPRVRKTRWAKVGGCSPPLFFSKRGVSAEADEVSLAVLYYPLLEEDTLRVLLAFIPHSAQSRLPFLKNLS